MMKQWTSTAHSSQQPRELAHILHLHVRDLEYIYPRHNLIPQLLRPLLLLLHSPLLLFFLIDYQIKLFEIDPEAAMIPFEAFRVPLALQ